MTDFQDRRIPIPDAYSWTVTLGIPADTRTPIVNDFSADHHGVSVALLSGESGLLDKLELRTTTERAYLPTISPSSITEPEDPACNLLIRTAHRLEGILGMFGLIKLEYGRWEWTWNYTDPADGTERLYFSYSSNHETAPIRSQPLSDTFLSPLMVAALSESSNNAALTLNLFREGEWHFNEFRYIDAIRSYYFALEHECAAGKTGKRHAVPAIATSKIFCAAVDNVNELLIISARRGDIGIDKIREVFADQDYKRVADWCYDRRGGLSHISGKRNIQDKWAPSHHIPFKSDAVILRAICSGIAETVALELFE